MTMEERTAKTKPVGELAAEFAKKIASHRRTTREVFNPGIEDDDIYGLHSRLVVEIGNDYCRRERREFEVDEHNANVLRFLLYYFNGSGKALDVFPGRDYGLHKNLLIVGSPGTGKTLVMQVFADYLRLTDNPNKFQNLSLTQMANHYKLHGNIDRYTYNEEGGDRFEGNPFNLCLNDIGIEMNQKSFGTDMDAIVDEFLFARYEIYQHRRKRTHLTSNLSVADFKKKFEERLVDRFKSYNVIPLTGESRRK